MAFVLFVSYHFTGGISSAQGNLYKVNPFPKIQQFKRTRAGNGKIVQAGPKIHKLR